MIDDLVTWDPHGCAAWEAARGDGQRVLLHSLKGFIDAGRAGSVIAHHILDESEAVRVATFDVDRLLDYRSRRPEMTFSVSEWTDYDEPYLAIDMVTDASGVAFLLLHGSEPDVLWEAFIRATRAAVERLGVTLTLGAHGIPMAAPHTRELQATVHGTRPELLPTAPAFFGTVSVPASASNLLEYRFGQWGLDAVTIALHVPHYLAQSSYPQAAQRAMAIIHDLTTLDLAPGELDAAALAASEEIARQMEESEEIESLVRALERQYDDFVESRRGVFPLDGVLPTAEEIGAEFEKFLADRGKDVL